MTEPSDAMIETIVETAARAAYERYFRGLIGGAEVGWDQLPQVHRDRLVAAQKAAFVAAWRRLGGQEPALQ